MPDDSSGSGRPGSTDLELRHLAALRAVATARSFGRAAETLGYTQSAVSQQVAALERAVGEPLFRRPGGPRPVELTAAGELLLDHARAILDRVEAARADLERFRAGELGRLTIGTFQSISVAALPSIVGRLRTERPDLELRVVEEDDTDRLLAALRAGTLDAAFFVGRDAGSGLETVVLGDDPFLLMSPTDSLLADRDRPVPLQHLAGLAMVGQTMNTCQVLMESHLRSAGVEPTTVFRTADNGAVQAMVRTGAGHAVMPRLAIDTADPGVVVQSLDPPLPPRSISLGLRADPNRLPALEALVVLACDICAGLLDRSPD